jgi:hypothetical protein
MASLRLRLENDERVPLREDQQEEIRKLLRGDDYNEAWLQAFVDSDVFFQSGAGNALRVEVDEVVPPSVPAPVPVGRVLSERERGAIAQAIAGSVGPHPPPILRTFSQQMAAAIALSLEEGQNYAVPAAAPAAAPAPAPAPAPADASPSPPPPEPFSCPICAEDDAEHPPFSPPGCEHQVCQQCTVGWLRSALGNKKQQIFAGGVRCMMHPAGCEAYIGPGEAKRLVAPSAGEAGGGGPGGVGALEGEGEESAQWLTAREFANLERFAVEATIPADQKQDCPGCGEMCLLAGADVTHVVCPHCRKHFHLGAEVQGIPGMVARGEMDKDTAYFAMITTKACPNEACLERITHYHGHHCHNISPDTDGCPRCHQHFCYVCQLPHGTPGHYSRNPACPHGNSFCDNMNIRAHVVLEPFPHDSRCGCPICPDCRRGAPCENCDGDCVVCEGDIEPSPLAVAAPPGWAPTSSFQLPNPEGGAREDGGDVDEQLERLRELLEDAQMHGDGVRAQAAQRTLALLNRIAGGEFADGVDPSAEFEQLFAYLAELGLGE